MPPHAITQSDCLIRFSITCADHTLSASATRWLKTHSCSGNILASTSLLTHRDRARGTDEDLVADLGAADDGRERTLHLLADHLNASALSGPHTASNIERMVERMKERRPG
eukprot:2352559-Rhodomonas_salina.2